MTDEQATQDAQSPESQENWDEQITDLFKDKPSKSIFADMPNVQFMPNTNPDEPPRDGAILRSIKIEIEQGLLLSEEGRLTVTRKFEHILEELVSNCKSTLESSPDCSGLILSHSEYSWGTESVAPFSYRGAYFYYEYKIPTPSA